MSGFLAELWDFMRERKKVLARANYHYAFTLGRPDYLE